MSTDPHSDPIPLKVLNHGQLVYHPNASALLIGIDPKDHTVEDDIPHHHVQAAYRRTQEANAHGYEGDDQVLEYLAEQQGAHIHTDQHGQQWMTPPPG